MADRGIRVRIKRWGLGLLPGHLYQNKNNRRSRAASFGEIDLAQIVVVTITGPVMAGFLGYLGISESTAAVLMQLSVLGAAAQGISPLFFMRRKNRLKLVTLFFALYRVLNVGMLIPIFLSDVTAKTWVFALFCFGSYFTGYFAEPAWQEYLTGIVPFRMRGRFFGKWDASYIAVGALYSLLASYLLDRFRAVGAERSAFLLLFFIMAIAAAAEIAMFFLMREIPVRLPKNPPSPGAYLSMPLRDRSFRKILATCVAYNIAQNLALSFISIYPVTVLKLDYTFIAVSVALGTLSRVITGPLWGKLADRRSWRLVVSSTTLLLGLSLLLFSFVTGWTYLLLLPLAHIVNGAGLGGATFGVMNLNMHHADPAHKALYIGVSGSAGALAGFLSSLVGAGLATLLTNVSFQVGSLHFGYMQLLFLLSALLFVCVTAYLRHLKA